MSKGSRTRPTLRRTSVFRLPHLRLQRFGILKSYVHRSRNAHNFLSRATTIVTKYRRRTNYATNRDIIVTVFEHRRLQNESHGGYRSRIGRTSRESSLTVLNDPTRGTSTDSFRVQVINPNVPRNTFVARCTFFVSYVTLYLQTERKRGSQSTASRIV